MKRKVAALALGMLLGSEAALTQSVVFLVRHADRASSAEDSLLSPQGEERAKCLARTLRDAHIATIFTTSVKRTQQTAAPVAEEFHLQANIIAKASSSELVKQVEQSDSRPVLVVGHADTLPGIVQQLGAGEIPKFEDREYDRLIVIPIANGKAQPALTLHYCSAQSDAAGLDPSMP
jgi:broad specificity phosphatase PhoE